MKRLSVIRVRLWFAAALPAVLVIVLLLVGFHHRQNEALRNAMRGQAQAAASQLASSAEFMLFAHNDDGLAHLVEAAKSGSSQIRGAAVHDANGNRLAVAGQVSMPKARLEDTVVVGEGNVLWVAVPIRHVALAADDLYSASSLGTVGTALPRVLGYAVVEVTLDALHEQQMDLLVWALVTACVGLLLAGLLSSWITSSVSRPITQIVQAVSRIRRGDMSARVDVEQSGVLQPLAEGVNAMAQQVAQTQEDLRAKVAKATEELRWQKEVAERTARTDSLTGIANRRAFTERAEIEIERAQRYGTPLSIIMIDLDHFKKINDLHGHAAGDAILSYFAAAIEPQIREVDMFARLGGEEFAVLLPSVQASDAVKLAERMRVSLNTHVPAVNGAALQYSASFGVAEFNAADRGLHRWLARADAALYQAKALGRNRVELAVI